MQYTLSYILGAILFLSMMSCRQWQDATRAARFSILDSDSACGETSYRTLEIELRVSEGSPRSTITLNGNAASWKDIGPTLSRLFSAHADKYVYLRTGPGVTESDESAITHLIESAGAERLCLLDFKAPHKHISQTAP